MELSKQEICRNYAAALNKKKQIGILADLNGVPRSVVIKILTERGYYEGQKDETTEKPKPKRKRISTRLMFDRLDELDTLIRSLEKQKAEYERQYKLISDYLQKGGNDAGIQVYFR